MGSILRIVQTDPTDIFLTGNPTITYFRSIYRRHTNFSCEIKEIQFDNTTGFDTKSSVVIPKYADLIHKMYLKVKIPEFYISKNLDTDKINEQEKLYNSTLEKYNFIKEYFKYNFNEYRSITSSYNTINFDTITESESNIILQSWYTTINQLNNVYINNYPISSANNINNIINDTDFNKYVNNVLNRNTSNNYFIYSDSKNGNISIISLEAYMTSILESTNPPTYNYILKDAYNRCTYYINKCCELDKLYFNYLQSIKQELDKLKIPRYEFAWVDKLGHSIIDYIEITIGGQTIDKQYGFWIDVWYELNKSSKNEKYYNKLIGNVKTLTTYDTSIKPEYIMYIPLNFWFCKYESLSLPLVSLQYTDVIVNIKFRKFSECAYTSFKYQANDDLLDNYQLLDNIIISQNKNLEASLMIEYIYLGDSERKLFAKSSHEYLIEQTQFQQISNININKNDVQLSFIHPVKGFVWFFQYDKNYINSDNTTKCLWTNYQLIKNIDTSYVYNNTYKHDITQVLLNPLSECDLTIEGRNISQKLSAKYYNYVQSWQIFKNSPAKGIYMFWFSLFPNEIQPSGFCNMGYVREFKINYTLELDNIEDPYTMTIIALNYNILRITSGMGAVAYI